MKRYLSILLVAICLFNVAKVEAYSREATSGVDEFRTTSANPFKLLSDSKEDSLNPSQDFQHHPDDDCGSGQYCHDCHLGHCSFVLVSAPKSPKLSFRIAHFAPLRSVYASGIVRRVPRPPQV